MLVFEDQAKLTAGMQTLCTEESFDVWLEQALVVSHATVVKILKANLIFL